MLSEKLENEVVIAKFTTTTKHGAINGKTQTHLVDYYNLDMIISIGYRVKSKNCIIFRKIDERKIEYKACIEIITKLKFNETGKSYAKKITLK